MKGGLVTFGMAAALAGVAAIVLFRCLRTDPLPQLTGRAEIESLFREYGDRLAQGYLATLNFGRLSALLDTPTSLEDRQRLAELCMERLADVGMRALDDAAILEGKSCILTVERSCWRNIEAAIDSLRPFITNERELSCFFKRLLTNYKAICFCCETPIVGETFQGFRWRKFYAEGLRLGLKNNLAHLQDTLCPYVSRDFSMEVKDDLEKWTHEFCRVTLVEMDVADKGRKEYAHRRWGIR